MDYLIFTSWTADLLPMAPILWITASATSPKHTTLRLLSALSRRPLVLTGVRRGDFESLPCPLCPTLLFDEPDLHRTVQHPLHSSSRRGVCTVNGRRMLNFYGSKIVLSREFPHEARSRGDALKISLMPTRGQRAFLDLGILPKAIPGSIGSAPFFDLPHGGIRHAMPMARWRSIGRQCQRCRQVSLQQQEQGIRGNVQVEVH
jgi:hypothetical protein